MRKPRSNYGTVNSCSLLTLLNQFKCMCSQYKHFTNTWHNNRNNYFVRTFIFKAVFSSLWSFSPLQSCDRQESDFWWAMKNFLASGSLTLIARNFNSQKQCGCRLGPLYWTQTFRSLQGEGLFTCRLRSPSKDTFNGHAWASRITLPIKMPFFLTTTT